MKPSYKRKFATPVVHQPDNVKTMENGFSETSLQKSKECDSKTAVSLSDSQYEKLFATVSKRVLECDFLDLDERFAGSQEALEYASDLAAPNSQKKEKMKQNRKKAKKSSPVTKAAIHGTENETSGSPLESFAKSVSHISTDSNRRDNEITPAVSPQEQNTIMVKKPKPQKRKREPVSQAKRRSLEYLDKSNESMAQDCMESRAQSKNLESSVGGSHHDPDTWVQCSKCEKWRLLQNCRDPSLLPDVWICSMNPSSELAKCSVPEENWEDPDSQTEYVYSRFTPGSLVWAKMDGYPSWPAMVDYDPDSDSYCEQSSGGKMTCYHVVFLDERVSRAWIASKKIEAYRNDETPIKLHRDSSRKNDFGKDLQAAKKKAQEAAEMTVMERINMFSFASRFHGKSCWSRDRNSLEKRIKKKAREKKPMSDRKSRKSAEATVRLKDQPDTANAMENFNPKNKLSSDKENVQHSPICRSTSLEESMGTRNNMQEPEEESTERKEISVISMSDVSLEKQHENGCQQGNYIDDCDTNLNMPIADENTVRKSLELDPDIFTMEIKSEGFSSVFGTSPVNNRKNGRLVAKASNIKVLDALKDAKEDHWLSSTNDAGIPADNMFGATPSANPDEGGKWDDLENLIMDIPSCI